METEERFLRPLLLFLCISTAYAAIPPSLGLCLLARLECVMECAIVGL